MEGSVDALLDGFDRRGSSVGGYFVGEDVFKGGDGGDDEFGVGLVGGVEEGDEAAGDVTLGDGEEGDIGDDDGREGAGDFEVVGGAEGVIEEVLEGEEGYFIGDRFWDVDRSAPDVEFGVDGGGR